MDRNIPVARLEPVLADSSADPESQLARLERKGIIRRAQAAIPASLFDESPPKAKKGSSVLQALLDERLSLAAQREGFDEISLSE